MIVNAVVRIVVSSALLASSFALRASMDRADHTRLAPTMRCWALFKEWRAFEEPPQRGTAPVTSPADG